MEEVHGEAIEIMAAVVEVEAVGLIDPETIGVIIDIITIISHMNGMNVIGIIETIVAETGKEIAIVGVNGVEVAIIGDAVGVGVVMGIVFVADGSDCLHKPCLWNHLVAREFF